MRKYIDELKPNTEEELQPTTETDEREEKWAQQREEFGFDDRETWDLDIAFAEFMYERLMRFNEINDIATTKEKRYKFQGRVITLQECLDRMIEGFKTYITTDYYRRTSEEKQKIEEAMDIFRECWQALWW